MIKSNEYFNVLSTREVPTLGWFDYKGRDGKAESTELLIAMDTSGFKVSDDFVESEAPGVASAAYLRGEVDHSYAKDAAAEDFNIVRFGGYHTALVDAEVDGHFTYALPSYAAIAFCLEPLTVVTADSLGSDHVTVQEVERIPANHPMTYVIQGGWGMDGGFGDYSSPYFGSPMTFNNDLLFMNDKVEMVETIEELNRLASDAFYSVGVHDSYDGNFPYEYTMTAVPGIVPSHAPITGDKLIDIVKMRDELKWYEQ